MDNARVFNMSFASVYPHYINKAERKGRTKEEVDTIIHWLTGYDEQMLQQHIEKKSDFEITQSTDCNENMCNMWSKIRRNRR